MDLNLYQTDYFYPRSTWIHSTKLSFAGREVFALPSRYFSSLPTNPGANYWVDSSSSLPEFVTVFPMTPFGEKGQGNRWLVIFSSIHRRYRIALGVIDFRNSDPFVIRESNYLVLSEWLGWCRPLLGAWFACNLSFSRRELLQSLFFGRFYLRSANCLAAPFFVILPSALWSRGLMFKVTPYLSVIFQRRWDLVWCFNRPTWRFSWRTFFRCEAYLSFIQGSRISQISER